MRRRIISLLCQAVQPSTTPAIVTRRIGVLGARRCFTSGPHVWGDIPAAGSRSSRGSEEDDGPQPVSRGARTVAAPPPVDFVEESRTIFDRVTKGVEGMKAVNKHFVVTRDEMEVSIDLGPEKGAFTLQRDLGKNEIVLMSPHSGVHRYNFDAEERRWLCVEADRHDLVGILTRDLIRHATGLPQI